jgi:LysR family transcriptional regulator, transcriptional activator for bauABCD operon
VHITISVLITDEMERRLLDGTVHLAFCAMHRPKSGLAYSHVAKEVQSVYCGRLHPLYSKPDELIRLEDLTRPDYVGRTFQDTLRTREKPFRTGPAASANNLEAILILLQTGRYLGLMPDQCAAPWVAAGEIRALRPDLTRLEQDFALVTRDTKRPAPVVEAFQKTYREEVSKQNAAQMA